MIEKGKKILLIILGIFLAIGLFFVFKQVREKQSNPETPVKQKLSAENQNYLSFHEAIENFKNAKTLKEKRKILFALEEIAISSPAHRQSVLYFLNSLNAWMRENAERIKYENFWAWRTKKEKKTLSPEIPSIYENIIQRHNEDFSHFSDEEKRKFALNFSNFIFPEIDFSKFIFPQKKTSFRKVLFFGNTDFQGAEFLGDVDFSNATFFGKVNFSGAKFFGSVRFKNVEFLNVDFQGAEFLGDVSFENATFKKGGNFQETQFSGKANFSGAKFFEVMNAEKSQWETANFENAVFKSDARFSEARFKTANFKKVRFETKFSYYDNRINFQEAKFLGDVSFEGAIFAKSCSPNFQETQFSGKANFSGLRFFEAMNAEKSQWETANFENAVFKSDALFSEARFKTANFKKVRFEGNVYSRGAKFHTADFSGAEFIKVEIFFDNAEFYTANFSGIVLLKVPSLNFDGVKFLERANFQKVIINKIGFSGVTFQTANFKNTKWKLADLRGAQFLGKVNFENADFTSFVSARVSNYGIIWDIPGAMDFMPPKTFEKIRAAGGQFSPEQIAYFENLKKQFKKSSSFPLQTMKDIEAKEKQYDPLFQKAIENFENAKTLKEKRKILFTLEEIAISSPAHRQSVLDFLNSLNSWMWKNANELKNADFEKWRNEKAPLLPPEKVQIEKQILSAEIPKIFENIIRRHNEEFPHFSDEKKWNLELRFEGFVFPEMDFSGMTFFPEQKGSFDGAIFFGKTNFQEVIFFERVNFFGAEFFGDVNFNATKFFDEASFNATKFFGMAKFDAVKFFRKANFHYAEFFGSLDFKDATFSGGVDFNAAKFFEKITFQNASFTKSPIKNKNYYYPDEEKIFMPPKIFEKIRAAGGQFSPEQIAYFENLKKSQK